MNDSWRWIRRLFKYGVPSVLLVLIIAATWDSFHRWPVAREALKAFPDQRAVLVGFGAHIAGQRRERHASYQLLPSGSKSPGVVRISQEQDGSVHVDVEQSGYLGFVLSVASTLVVIAICVRLWIRGPPNNRWSGP